MTITSASKKKLIVKVVISLLRVFKPKFSPKNKV